MGKEGSEGKLLVKLLNVLAMFLRAGLVEGSGIGEQDAGVERWPFPLRYVEAHMLPKRSNAFAHLNLFGPPRDEDGDMYVELEERQRVFYKRYQATILSRAEDMKREGGEVGRAAAGVGKAVAVRMEGFDA